MSQRQRPDNERNVDPVANPIGRAYAAPALPTDLQQRLAEDLDAAFAAANDPIQAARNGSLAKLLEKKYEVVGDNLPPAVQRGEISRLRYELHDLAAPAERRMGVGRRVALAGAAAAVLLACVWSQPGYRWSEVVESVRQQPFVQVEEVSNTSEAAAPRLVATRRDQAGKRRPTTASYLSMSGDILRQVSGENAAGSRLLPTARRAELVESDLVATLLDVATPGEDAKRAKATVSQSWPRAADDAVALDLVIRCGDQRVDATLQLNPTSKLPISCELRPADAPVKHLRFRYSAADPAGDRAE
ncbi:hypothetical protein KOR34_03500 [Posidoniimonas corsicana]|uniref:Uncharacterized protein n=1 Tax=Posidoniimonas corsicana TaxID=1938618 RepID=A0A5C5VA67_9BACT|nr:hypothetical protein [Posidoniimonas corsicana]TWT35458.1 hypothetical protein KOR34_03500 [Posidoniimonas corsicana]